MLKYVSSLILASILPAMASAQPVSAPKMKHVIYITLDGTRWQDVFIDKRLPNFWNKHAAKGIWYGQPETNRTIKVASIPISMPSYQSQTSGYVQPCPSNQCDRIGVQTMQERILKEFNFNKKDVASFSSWHMLTNAVESVYGVTYSNVGNAPVYDPETNIADAEMERLNALQENEPNEDDRFDKFTSAQALHYFRTYQPRFMWISLTDADEAAHANNKAAYHAAFALYDNMLDELFTMLDELHLAKDTMVIITTDHGRGNGKNWTSHGPQLPCSKRTWAFVYNGDLKPIGQDGNVYRYSTLSIRPTIEDALISN